MSHASTRRVQITVSQLEKKHPLRYFCVALGLFCVRISRSIRYNSHMKDIIIVLVAVVVLGGIYFVATNKPVEPINNKVVNSTVTVEEENADLSTNTVNGMRVEENAVVATEQRPARTVKVAQVYLAAPGYVVIHEDTDEEVGAILGSSDLLKAGENNNVVVTLNRSTKDGEKLWSMLHSEANSNTTFDLSVDTPVESNLGGPVSGWFEINATAEENIEVIL